MGHVPSASAGSGRTVCASGDGGATMKATAFLKQARREAQLVDALLVARYALVIHDGMTLLGDGKPPTRWQACFKAELMRIDAALQMAGIDTQQPLRPPMLDRHDGDGDGVSASDRYSSFGGAAKFLD